MWVILSLGASSTRRQSQETVVIFIVPLNSAATAKNQKPWLDAQIRQGPFVDDVVRGQLEARRLAGKMVPSTHHFFIRFQRYDAQFAAARGDLAAAIRHQDEVLGKLAAKDDLQPATLAVARAEKAVYLARANRRKEARDLLALAMPPLREHLLPQHVNRARFEGLARQLGV